MNGTGPDSRVVHLVMCIASHQAPGRVQCSVVNSYYYAFYDTFYSLQNTALICQNLMVGVNFVLRISELFAKLKIFLQVHCKMMMRY